MGTYDELFDVGPLVGQEDNVNQLIQEELAQRKQNAQLPQRSTGLGALFQGIGSIAGDVRSRNREQGFRTERAGLQGQIAGLHSRYADMLQGSKPEDLPMAAAAGELSGSPYMAKAGAYMADPRAMALRQAAADDRSPALRTFYGGQLADVGARNVPQNLPLAHIKEFLTNARQKQQAENQQTNAMDIAREHSRSAAEVARINGENRVAASGMGGDIVSQIGDGIMDGTTPPDLKGNMRLKGPIQAYLHENGFNLSDAQRDWAGTTARVKALNSDQQIRVRESIDATHEALDNIDKLYGEWKNAALATGRFKSINKANLEVSKQFGGPAGAAAHALEGAIADWKGKYANVLMGGNAPTDRALKLVDNNLSGSWDDASMTKGIQLARRVLKMQETAMNRVTTAGGSRYDNNGGAGGGSLDPALQKEVNEARDWIKKNPLNPKLADIKANFKKMHGVDL